MPYFFDTLAFMIRKNKLTERETYKEKALPPPEYRDEAAGIGANGKPIVYTYVKQPEILELEVFSNSTMHLKFDTDMKFKNNEKDP